MNIEKDKEVARVQPGDYTDGRKGTTIEIDTQKQRARVNWHTEASGQPMKPLRTWVKFSCLRQIP